MSERCCGQAYQSVGRFGNFAPCANRGKIEREGKFYCGIHDPERVEARNAKWAAEYKRRSEEQSARWAYQREQGQMRDRALEAIHEIAAGHNDPRSLAIQVLEGAGAIEKSPLSLNDPRCGKNQT